MYLQQAFEQWVQEEGGQWGVKSRPAMQRVFFRMPNFTPLQNYTKEYVRDFLQKSTALRQDKVQAASALVAVLKYHHNLDPSVPIPDFDYTIASPPQPAKTVRRMIHYAPVTPVVPEKSASKKKEEKKSGHYTRRVVQIDKKTLQPIRVFKSISDAMRTVHATDMARALKEHSPSGGFYWSYEETLEDFKPRERKKPGPNNKTK